MNASWFNGLKPYLVLPLAVLLAACSDAAQQASAPPTNDPDVALVEIELSPQHAQIALGTQMRLYATGIYADHTKKDISSDVMWTSAAPESADFITSETGPSGVVVGKKTGVIALHASLGDVRSQDVDLIVTDPVLKSLSVEPLVISAAAGTTMAFVATGHYDDGSQQVMTDYVTWVSSDTSIAIFNNSSPGVARAVRNGLAMIHAELGAVSSDAVSFTVTAPSLSAIEIETGVTVMGLGTHTKVLATGIFSDSSRQDLSREVVWNSSNDNVVSVEARTGEWGLVTALSAGTSEIRASLNTITSNSVGIKVIGAKLQEIQIGLGQSNPSDNYSMALGTSLQLYATGIYSDLTIQDLTYDVIWGSADVSIATVDNSVVNPGLVFPVTMGQTKLTALFQGVLSKLVTLTVTDAQLQSIAVTPLTSTLSLGTTQQYAAMGYYSDASTLDITGSVLWVSTDSGVADISNNQTNAGLATAKIVGQTNISAQRDGVTSNLAQLTTTDAVLISIDIVHTTASVSLGETWQFNAEGTYSDASTRDITGLVAWQSTLPSVATVSNAGGSYGLATSYAEGTTTIKASLAGISSETPFTVTAAMLKSLNISPKTATLQPTQTQQFSATGVYTNGTVDVTRLANWTSTNPAVATVVEGLVTAEVSGTTDIILTYGGRSVAAGITVTPAPPNVVVSNVDGLTSVDIGAFLPLSATGGTAPYLWSVDNSNASIDTATGLLKGLAAGNVTVTATDVNSNSGSAVIKVTVPPVVLTSIDITPKNSDLMSGQSIQFAAQGIYSDSSVAVLTNDATWTSSNPSIVSFSSTTAGFASATAGASGAVLITVEVGTISASTQLNILAPVSVSAGGVISVDVGQSLTLSANGGTPPYKWSVNNSNAVINMDSGYLTGQAVGPVIVTAQDLNGYTGSLPLDITAAPVVLQSIALTPVDKQVTSGKSVQYTATGSYSDGSSADITGSVIWTSGDPARMSFSTIVPGLATATLGATGVVNVKASLDGITANTQLTILAPIITVSTQATTIQAQGPVVQFNASGGTTPYTWEVNDVTLGTINALGLLTPLKVGSITITAKDSAGFTGSGVFNISGPSLAGLFTDPVLQACVDSYAAANGFTTADQISTLDYYCAGLGKPQLIQDLSGIENLTNLTFLDISANDIMDFTPLGALRNLVELSISNNIFTPVTDLTPLGNLNQLTALHMGNGLLKPASIGLTSAANLAVLGSLGNLQTLDLSYQGIGTLTFITGLTSLSWLHLAGNNIAAINELSGLLNLTHLYLGDNNITDISPLNNTMNLNVLTISNNIGLDQVLFDKTFTPPLAPTPYPFGQLTQLEMRNTGITDIIALGNLPRLNSLMASGNGITDAGIVNPIDPTLKFATPSLKASLQLLDVSKNNISNVTTLGDLTNLYFLDLNANTGLTSISALGGLTNLTILNINNNQIANAADFSVLDKMPLLTNLHMNNTGIGDLTPLTGLTQLTTLDLNDNSIIDLAPLRGLIKLNTLNLLNNKIVDVGPLIGMTQMRSLLLIGNAITVLRDNTTNPPPLALASMSLASSIFLTPADYLVNPLNRSNTGISCADLTALIAVLNVNRTVLYPDQAIPGTSCTSP